MLTKTNYAIHWIVIYLVDSIVCTKYVVALELNALNYFLVAHTPNANMADHSVSAWDELHESEASQASVFCFDDAFIQKS